MCVFQYIELGVGSPTLFNPPPAPCLLCFGLWKCGGKTTHPSNLCIRSTSPVGTLSVSPGSKWVFGAQKKNCALRAHSLCYHVTLHVTISYITEDMPHERTLLTL